jgi:cytochrome c oxidase assembly protein subunit 15
MQPANLWLSRYAKFVVAFTLLLISVGGTVTTKKAGLSVPDWPTSFGHNMFTLPFHFWEGDVFWEHSHRLIGSVMGMLIIGLVIWVCCAEKRKWVKNLAWLSLVVVIIQGLMGGYRVTELSILLAIIHGCTAQFFFCLVLFIAMVLSPEWKRPLASSVSPNRVALLKPWAWGLVAAIFIQLILGAVMRHLDAGLAVPTFPYTPFPSEHNLQIEVHIAHRLWAIVVSVIAVILVTKVLSVGGGERRFRRPAWTLVALLVIQIALGWMIIETQRKPHPTTSHVVNGALVLAVSVVLAVRSNRFSALDQANLPSSSASADRVTA